MISFLTLSQELLEHVRSKRSHSGMDSYLNLGSGQYLRWESGDVEIKWDDFVLVCKKMSYPIAEALRESLSYTGNPFNYDLIIAACVGKTSQETLGKQLDVTRYTVNRWVNRKASPTLTQILRILHSATTKLPVFIKALIGGDQLRSFESYLAQTDSMLGLIQEMPWISGITCALSLDEYKCLPEHSHSWLTQKLGIPESTIELSVVAMERHGLLHWNETHYELTLNEINPSVLKEKAKDLLIYWMTKNLEAVSHSYPSPDKKSLSSYHVFSVDHATADAIKSLYRGFTNDLALLVNKGMDNPEHIYSFTLSMIHFDDHKKEVSSTVGH